jgi:hypothetical protein
VFFWYGAWSNNMDREKQCHGNKNFWKKQIICHYTMSFEIFIQMELNFHKTVNSYFLIIWSSLIVHNNMMPKYYLCFFLGHLLVSLLVLSVSLVIWITNLDFGTLKWCQSMMKRIKLSHGRWILRWKFIKIKLSIETKLKMLHYFGYAFIKEPY